MANEARPMTDKEKSQFMFGVDKPEQKMIENIIRQVIPEDAKERQRHAEKIAQKENETNFGQALFAGEKSRVKLTAEERLELHLQQREVEKQMEKVRDDIEEAGKEEQPAEQTMITKPSRISAPRKKGFFVRLFGK